MPEVLDTRAALVDVAAGLLRDRGSSAVTTRGVAEAAGVQAPTIYRLFGDKDGLLDAVAEHVMAQFVSAKADAVSAASDAELDPVEDLRAGWRTYVDFGLTHPTLFTLLTDPGRASRSSATRSGLHVLEVRVRRVAQAGRLRVSERRAVELVHAAGTGVVLTLLATPPPLRDPTLADDLFDTVSARLLTDAATDPGAHVPVVSAAITLHSVASELTELSPAETSLLTEWLERIIDGGPPPEAG